MSDHVPPAIDYADPNVLVLLQAAVCAVQEAIFAYEGTVARLLADDKGTRFKIAFGMPSNAHEGMYLCLLGLSM